MVQLTEGAETSASAILAEIGRELKIESSMLKLFALWVCSDSLSASSTSHRFLTDR